MDERDREIAKAVMDFWDFIIDEEIGDCYGGYNEWCANEMFLATERVCKCTAKLRKKSIFDCIEKEKKTLKRMKAKESVVVE